MSHTHLLLLALIGLIIVSSFFSGSETGMMALNRYRLRHLVRQNNKIAMRVSRLLERPDRLLGVVLIGNTFANMLVSAVATLLTLEWFGNAGVLLATIAVSLIVLVFSEIMPKTLAAMYPERFAFPASWLLSFLLIILYPLVWAANTVSNAFLWIFGVQVKQKVLDELTGEEVRTIVHEATSQLSRGYKHMMLGVLDLGGITVDDIKVPRSNIVGIDLAQDWAEIERQLATSQHTRLPVYRENLDQVHGMLHLRKALNLAAKNKLNKQNILDATDEVYFIPSGTPLNVQLLNFRQQKSRIGLVVDEYGDIEGLVTLEDILEEIVGEFTTNLPTAYKSIQRQRDGSYLVDGSISIRELNRQIATALPIDGPKTLSGLIIECLEAIPESPVALCIEGYRIEVLKVEENTVKMVKIDPLVKGESSGAEQWGVFNGQINKV